MFLKSILNIIQLALFLIGCYYFLVALFSVTIFEKKPLTSKMNSFALIIAAHNEKTVIGELVKSLNSLDYPKHLFEVIVIADNCTDDTANLARQMGATVWERFDSSARGKGYAMEFAFKKLFALERQFDYICVFDADNLVKSDFLNKINNKINEGYRAVQGYLDSKNPCDNWLTFSYSMWYWLNNRLSQLARGNLGIGCRLGGTGFAVDTNLIKEYGWGATCLAEDTEFTLKIALNDIKVGWAHDAVVYDEKPTKFETSVHQRTRWMQGLSDVAVNYVKPLAQKTVSQKSVFSFHMLMNFWGDTLYPLTTLYFWAVYLLSFISSESLPLYHMLCEFWDAPLNMLLLSGFCWGNLFLCIMALYSDKKLDKNIMKNSPSFFIYILSWIPIGIIGFLRRNKKEWFHTPHSNK